MSRTLINGTGYDVSGGRTLIGGTGYGISGGKTLIGGTGQTISFGTLISSLAVGSSVYMNVNGTRTEFLVIQQGLPSSEYDSSCNGTWVLMKDIYTSIYITTAFYKDSSYESYLNDDFFKLLDSNIQSLIKQAKLPLWKYSVQTVSNKIFLLSGIEVGGTSDYIGESYALLAYFTTGSGGNSNRIAKLKGNTCYWATRSIDMTKYDNLFQVTTLGYVTSTVVNNNVGIRPAFILPSTTKIDDNNNIIG